jgi:DNA-directed RNA polymerase specialized sigma24 family protein
MESDPQTSRGRPRGALDRQGWDALLEALDQDREEAGKKYEALRRRLINLFSWEQRATPEDLADEVFNRLSRKVTEGAVIPNVDRFAFGIARMLIQEEIRRDRNQQSALRELTSVASKPNSEDWSTLDAMQGCLDVLPSDRRELIELYYTEDRARLARKIGISLNALRNRAMRIREELFRCMSQRDGS